MNDFFDSMAKVYARIISREKSRCDISGEAPSYTLSNVPEELRESVAKMLESQNNK